MAYYKIPLAERMQRYTDRSGGPDTCWPWTRSRNADGYGKAGVGTRAEMRAHRAAWQVAYGAIPDGMCVLHHCDNPACCNPRHLFLGTNVDNIADKVAKGRQRGPQPGERNHSAKLTDQQALEIRERYAAGGVRQRQIAAEYGVGQSQISRVVRGQRQTSQPPQRNDAEAA